MPKEIFSLIEYEHGIYVYSILFAIARIHLIYCCRHSSSRRNAHWHTKHKNTHYASVLCSHSHHVSLICYYKFTVALAFNRHPHTQSLAEPVQGQIVTVLLYYSLII